MARDISKMYHRVLIPEQDQQVHQYLWRNNMETEGEPDVYVLKLCLHSETNLHLPWCDNSCNNRVATTVAKIRKTFWILRARSQFSQDHKVQMCTLLRIRS